MTLHPSDHHIRLAAKLATSDAVVTVIGLGYVGLSLAAALARAGFRVHGVDVDLEKVSLVNRGVSYIEDVAGDELVELIGRGRFSATTDVECVSASDVIVICVPTPLRKSKEPDISYILGALDAITPRLRAGQLVILESTTYPGTTEEVLQPRCESRGFTIGRDAFLAFSPERVDPGNKNFTTANIPKVVGGTTPACTDLAAALYGKITSRVHRVSSPRAAETAKLLENTFRSVNIGLANEIALACRAIGVDPWEVIDAAATKPFGFMAFYPGPGTGGHCIPLDPLYFSWKVRITGFETRFIALADDVNRNMPHHVVSLVVDALNDEGKCVRGANIMVLGVSYKRDVGDVRESPALEVMRLLEARGARISYGDPYVPELNHDGFKLTAVKVCAESLRAADCAVIITDHRAFDYDLIAREAPAVVDVRNALKDVKGARARVVSL